MVFYLHYKNLNIDKEKYCCLFVYQVLKQISLTQMQVSATSQRP